MGRLQCRASAVTMQPSSESICSTSRAPRASLRPGAMREASAMRASVAKTSTICGLARRLLAPPRHRPPPYQVSLIPLASAKVLP